LVSLTILLVVFLYAFTKKQEQTNSRIPPDKIAILIPFRNETEINAQAVFLKSQLAHFETEVFWVDDFSESIQENFLREVESFKNFNILKRRKGKPGKKEAISFGLQQVEEKWVLLMDADSRPDFSIFAEGGIPVKNRWRMVLFPLLPTKSQGIIRKFFDLEFIVLQLVTHASALFGWPLLANGATLLVNRESYLETLAHRRDFFLASGDDVFALFAFQSEYGRSSIGSVARNAAPFKVIFPSSFKALWKQRLRWVSKTSRVPSIWFLSISTLVFFANISFAFFVFAFLSLFAPPLIIWSLISYLIITSLFLFVAIKWFKRMDLAPFVFPAILVYPFYLSALLVASVIAKPKWK